MPSDFNDPLCLLRGEVETLGILAPVALAFGVLETAIVEERLEMAKMLPTTEPEFARH